jgi:hypothetical protein
MTTRTRMNICIASDLKDHLALLAHHRQVAMADIVEAALTTMLTPQAAPESLLMRRIEQVWREVRALQHAVEVLEETLGLFVNVYLSTTPEVPPAKEEEAKRIGGRRYARFVKVLEQQLARKQGLYREHPREGEHDADAGR